MRTGVLFTAVAAMAAGLGNLAWGGEPSSTSASVQIVGAAPSIFAPMQVVGAPSTTGASLLPPPPPPVNQPAGPVLHPADVADSGFCPGGHFRAGAGFYLLQPHFESNPAFWTTQTTSSPFVSPFRTAATVTERTDFKPHLEIAPQVWLGYVLDNGLGVRARWWHFEENAHAFSLTPVETDANTFLTVVTNAPLGVGFTSTANRSLPDAISYDARLHLDVWDFEATQDVQAGCWSLLFAGGVRHAHMSQNYDALRSRSGTIDTGFGGSTTFTVDSDTLSSGHSFDGTGPVLALEARRPLGDTGLALFGSARGAILFGSGKQQATLQSVRIGRNSFPGPIPFFMIHGASAVPPVSNFNTVTVNESFASWDDVLPVGELELGVEYARNIGPARLFAQLAFVGQVWWGADDSARSATSTFFSPGSGSADSNLGLIGLSLRTGVDY
jgi:hypothetical protein